jgi:CRP-like cAMP-binding protein
MATLPRKHFKRGEVIFTEGTAGDEAYRIVEGYVAITRNENGKPVALAMKGEREIFGEMALVDATERSATATADTELEVEVISREEMTRMLESLPETLAAVVHQLMESLRSANDLISAYASRPPVPPRS